MPRILPGNPRDGDERPSARWQEKRGGDWLGRNRTRKSQSGDIKRDKEPRVKEQLGQDTSVKETTKKKRERERQRGEGGREAGERGGGGGRAIAAAKIVMITSPYWIDIVMEDMLSPASLPLPLPLCGCVGVWVCECVSVSLTLSVSVPRLPSGVVGSYIDADWLQQLRKSLLWLLLGDLGAATCSISKDYDMISLPLLP